jgi:hypothetical protein
MNLLVSIAYLVVAQAPPRVELEFVQVAPARGSRVVERSPGQERAVVLINGLRPHPFSSRHVGRPDLSSWQKPRSSLVRALAKEADVFALAYSQNAPLDAIAQAPELTRELRRLKEAGYGDIVLVGHSAGGVLARLLVEDHPDLGVTKVVQVAAPNAGSSLAAVAWSVREEQEPFVRSLSHEARSKALEQRAGKRIPEKVALVCLVCQCEVSGAAFKTREVEAEVNFKRGDGVVSSVRQWSADLQAQGIPFQVLPHAHFTAMSSPGTAETLLRLIRETPPRWNEAETEAARMKLFGEKKEP